MSAFEYIKPPSGAYPCEATGVISTGEEFYFRYRGGRASITITPGESDPFGSLGESVKSQADSSVARFYETSVSSPAEMPFARANQLICDWVQTYLNESHIDTCN